MMDGSEQQKWTKCVMLQSFSSKSFRSMSSSSLMLCQVTQHAKNSNQSCDAYGRRWPGQVDTYTKMGKIERFILSRSNFMSVLGNTITSKKL